MTRHIELKLDVVYVDLVVNVWIQTVLEPWTMLRAMLVTVETIML